MGGNNHSKLCAGDFERELQRVEQEALKNTCILTPDPEEDAFHVYCRPDEVDQFVEEIRTGPVVFHFEMEKSPAMKPENFLEGGEKLGDGEMAAAAATVSGEAKLTDRGGDVLEKLSPRGGFVMRVEPRGDILVETDPSEAFTLADLCSEVARALNVAETSLRDSSDRTKGLSAVKGLPPSSSESQPSILSTGYQTENPPIAGAQSLNAGDVHHPHEDTFLDNEQKAPRGAGLELATEDLSRAPELEDVSSEETLKAAGDTTSDLNTTETAEDDSDAESKSPAKIWPSLGTVSEPLPILNERKEKGPEDYCDGGKGDAQLAMQPRRALRGALATVDAEDVTRQPIVSGTFPVDKSHKRSIHTLCETREAVDVLLACDTEGLPPLQKDGAIPMPEATKQNEHQMSVGQTMEAQPPTEFAEMNGAASSPKALLETAEMGPRGPMFSSTQPITQVSRMEDNHVGSQLSPGFNSVSDVALVDGSPGQRC